MLKVVIRIAGNVACLLVVLAGIAAVAVGPQGSEPTRKESGEMRGRISGVVVNSPTGKPIAGAYVAVDHSGDAGGSNLGRFRKQGIYVTTETDKEGRFVLEDVAFRDDHPFMVTHPGFVRHQQTIAVRRGEPAIDIHVRLKPAAAIVVKVVDTEGKLLRDKTMLRLEAKDRRVFLPMRADWPDLPYRTDSTKTGTFSFGELDTGAFSIEAMRIGQAETVYHAKVSDVAIEAGETKEVVLKPADHRSTVKIKIEKDPHAYLGETKGAAALLISRKPALLAWAGGNFYHLEDERLGRVWKSALVMAILTPAEDADTLRKTYTLRNFPPGEYAVFTYAMGMYKDWKSPAAYLRGAKAVISPGKERAVEIPWIEPIGPSPTNARMLYTLVNLEAGEYTAQEICELLMKETGAKAGEIVADSSIRDQKLAFRAAKLQIWDLLERIYLEKGWRLEADYKAKTLVLRPGASSKQ